MKSNASKQLTLLPPEKESSSHGGDLKKGKRKLRRPFNPKLPMHFVVRATRARGAWSMLHPRHEKKISLLIRTTARKNHVRVYRYVNVGNHLHLLIRAKDKLLFNQFLRVITGRIAAVVTGAVRGRPVGKFWDSLAYSRRVSWGRDFKKLIDYFLKNELQAVGFGDLVNPTVKARKKERPLLVL